MIQLLPTLTHGPLVGGVTPTEAIIFGRSNGVAMVQVIYDTDPDPSGGTLSSAVTTSAGADYTAHILLSDLSPFTQYYYSFVGVEDEGKVYSFTTFPEGEVPFVFDVLADLKTSPTIDAPAYIRVGEDNPAFVMQIGDFDHEDGMQTIPRAIETWRKIARRVIRDSAAGTTFANNIGARFPFIHMWDDHDFGKNDATKNCQCKGFAWQSYDEYYPAYPMPNSAAGRWHSFTYGTLAEVFVLDLRSQRDANEDTDGPNHSILDGDNLGATGQKQWLFDGLLNSTATWKFIISTSTFNPLIKPRDSWANFANEQGQLVEFITTNGVTGVIVLSGDIHSAGAIDDGTNSYLPELSIPHTNMKNNNCSTPTLNCGQGFWSHGVVIPTLALGGGYGRITVNGGSVLLEAVSESGTVRLSYEVIL